MYYVIAPTSKDLYHHGILGQKWGKQNGPPYPLGSSAHSASEKKAGWRKSLKDTNKNNDYTKVEWKTDNKNLKGRLSTDSGMVNKENVKIYKNNVIENKDHISNEVSNGMIEDLKRWNKNKEYTGWKPPEEFKNKSEKEVKKILSDRLKNALDTADYFYQMHDEGYNFSINGIKGYSDEAPLAIDFNPKTKKVTFSYA